MSTQTLANSLVWRADRFRLLESAKGGLRIWADPEPDRLYVAGIDTSKGGAKSDYAALSMVETGSRALVAAWVGRYDPTEWGRMCARLGLYYNTAMLAFETHPSQHGLSACLAARNMGYPNLYRRQQQGMVTMRITEELGWATTYKTKPLMVDRVRVALSEGYRIPAQDLLRSLLDFKRDEAGNVVSTGKFDDFFVSYAIAQIVCDLVGVSGFVTKAPEKPITWNDRWRAYRKELLDRGDAGLVKVAPRHRLVDGS